MNDFKDGLLQAANFTPISLRAPNSWSGHLPFAAWLIKQQRPALLVELGTHTGNSYFSFCQAAQEDGIAVKCYAVDTWQGDEHAGIYGQEVFEQVHMHNQDFYSGFSRLLRMTFDDAANYFADGSIDLLHIDGLHTYEAVKHDFDTWLPKLAPGAIVLFHDINVRERGFGVWQLWEELKERYAEHHEFVHSHGLGVLRIGGASEAAAMPWLQAGAPEQQLLRNYFSALGTRQVERTDLIKARADLVDMKNASLQHAQGLMEQIQALQNVVLQRDAHVQHLEEEITRREQEALLTAPPKTA
ncbi:class I SAM-dependent methyltransferase [Massilia eburnea]|uniref:class I SAM-dependent methyltransferase n=1 Tax=Massilia eburnea TaxID=1776165 RepID=UPI003D6C39AA